MFPTNFWITDSLYTSFKRQSVGRRINCVLCGAGPSRVECIEAFSSSRCRAINVPYKLHKLHKLQHSVKHSRERGKEPFSFGFASLKGV